MSQYTIRNLDRDDFGLIMQLEREIFGALDESLLCEYYVRVCCDFFADSCFIALDGDRPVAYLLCFMKGQTAYCTTLAIHPEYQRTRVILELLRSFVQMLVDRVDVCWFTVDEDNKAARALHRMLGAVEVEVRRDFYGPGVDRIVSMIDRKRVEELRPKYERLGFLERQVVTQDVAA